MLGHRKKQNTYLVDAIPNLVKAIQGAQRTFGRSNYNPKDDEDDAFSYFWSQTLPQCVPKRERSTSLMSPTISGKRAMSSSSMSPSTAAASPKQRSDTQALATGNHHVILALAYITKLKKNQITLNSHSFTAYLTQTFADPAFKDDVTEIVSFYQQLLDVLRDPTNSAEMVTKFSATAVDARTRKQLSEISELTDIDKSKKCKTQQDIVRLLVNAIRAYDLPHESKYSTSDSQYLLSTSTAPSRKPKPNRSGFFSCCCSADDSDDEEQSKRLLTVTSHGYGIN